MRPLLLAAPLALLAWPAAALPVTLTIAGTVSEATGLYAALAAPGDALAGTLAYDSTAARLALAASLTVDGTTLAADDAAPRIGVVRAPFDVFSLTVGLESQLEIVIASILTRFLVSDALPTALAFTADPADPAPSFGTLSEGTAVLRFDIVTATIADPLADPSAVPEPAGLGLVLLGGLALVRARRGGARHG